MNHATHSHAEVDHGSVARLGRPEPPATPAAQEHHTGKGWHAAASVTLHCLTGCLIGEWTGLAIGVTLSMSIRETVVLATVLAYSSGFGLTLWPLLRRGLGFWPSLNTVFIGEAVSIGVMEIAMNIVDYSMGGMGVKSLFASRYWQALSIAAIAGFLAAWPVNFWLLSRHMKKCH
jgi:hypothetical protein